MGAPRRFFRRGGGYRGSRGTGGPPRRPYQDENQVIIFISYKLNLNYLNICNNSLLNENIWSH